MSRRIYRVMVGAESRLRFSMDADAPDSVLCVAAGGFDHDPNLYAHGGYTTADVRADPGVAASMLIEDAHRVGGCIVGRDEVYSVADEATP